MMKGATTIVSLAIVWAVGCGTHSAIGGLGIGGDDGAGGGTGGAFGSGGELGVGGELGAGGSGVGGAFGVGGAGVGGNPAYTGGQPGHCAGPDAGAPPTAPAKTFAFLAPVDYPTGAGAIAVTAGDLNGDGKIDLALLDQTAGVRVMLNNGDGTFAGPVNYGIGSSTYMIALGDLDGDGMVDIACATTAGVSVLRNQGNAVFGAPLTYVVGNHSVTLALGDLNHDGRLDIAVADEGSASGTGDVGILLNAGGRTFSAQNFGMVNQPSSIALGDVDEDCQLDIVVADADGLSLLSTSNGPIGTYTQSHIANGTSGGSVVIADLDGDGKMDLVEGDRGEYAVGAVPGSSYVLLNRGLGAFTAPVRYPTLDAPDASGGGSEVAVAVGDLNGDGQPDFVGASGCCGMGVFLNRGGGAFGTPVGVPTVPYFQSLAHGDFNGDGLDDIAVVSFNNGQFAPASNLRVLINGSH